MSTEQVTLPKLLAYVQSVARNEPNTIKSDPPERATLFAVRDTLFVGNKKAAGQKKKRRQEEFINRPCSPSLFSQSASAGPQAQAKRLNLGERLETVLTTSVNPLYDRPSSASVIDDDRLVPAHRFTSLGYLLLPIRRGSVVEKWTPQEIAIFEAGISLHGKKFDVLKSFLPSKSMREVIEFYYTWKNTTHKQVWRKTYKLPE